MMLLQKNLPLHIALLAHTYTCT